MNLAVKMQQRRMKLLFQMPFSRKINEVILTDGGLGTTLDDYGLDIRNDPLWLRVCLRCFPIVLVLFS